MSCSFAEYCRRVLWNYFNDYASQKKSFGHVFLAKAKLSFPGLFVERSTKENAEILVEWTNTEVKITGPKLEVESKLQEIVESVADPKNKR